MHILYYTCQDQADATPASLIILKELQNDPMGYWGQKLKVLECGSELSDRPPWLKNFKNAISFSNATYGSDLK